MGDSEKKEDPRVAATATIAGCGIGALALSLIFGRTVGGVLLPVLVIAGIAIAIGAVWRFGDRRPTGNNDEIQRLQARIEDLEQRLEAAETVEAFEERLANKEATLRLEATQDAD